VSQLARYFNIPISPLRRYRLRVLGKGGVTRTVKFPGELIIDLKAYVEGERAFIVSHLGEPASDYLILHPTSVSRYGGKKVSTRTFERGFAAACIRAGLFTNESIEHFSWARDGLDRVEKTTQTPSFVFHDLRHTYAVWTYYKLKKHMAEPWLDIQACLGHKDLKTTLQKYLRCAQDFEARISDAYMETVNAI
jgi:integrase/recombinase XerC